MIWKRKTVKRVIAEVIEFTDDTHAMYRGTLAKDGCAPFLCGDIIRVVMAESGQILTEENIKKPPIVVFENPVPLENLMSLDIETVPVVQKFKDASDGAKNVFKKWLPKKLKLSGKDKEALMKAKAPVWQKHWQEQANFNPACCRIVCISVGFLRRNRTSIRFYTKSFFGDDQERLLWNFAEYLFESEEKGHFIASVGHSIDTFDKPLICRKCLKYAIPLPKAFENRAQKKWHKKDLHLDSAYAFPGFWGYSLEAQCVDFGLPSPKDTMDGSEVFGAWFGVKDSKWTKRDVITYCEFYDIKGNIQAACVYYRIDSTLLEIISSTSEEELSNLK